MKATTLTIAAILGLGSFVSTKADEIQFTTLPDVVKTTVVRQTNIPDYSRITRVMRDTTEFMRSPCVVIPAMTFST